MWSLCRGPMSCPPDGISSWQPLAQFLYPPESCMPSPWGGGAGLDRGGRARRGQGKRWGPEEEGGQAEQGERWQGGAGVGERKPQGFKSSNGFPIDFFRKNCFLGPLPALTYCFSRRNPLRNSSLDRPRKLRNPAWAEKKDFLLTC